LPVVVEIAEGAAARSDGDGDAEPASLETSPKCPLRRFFVEQLALRIAASVFELLDFGDRLAVAD